MKRKIKASIILFICTFVLITVIYSGYQLYRSKLTNNAIHYLCEKYSAEKSDFEVLGFHIAHHYIDKDSLIYVKKSNNVWELKYSGRVFFVHQIDNVYYDDYQLEDVELWAVRWLQKNVDKNIAGIELNTFDLYSYQKEKFPSNPYHIISSNEIKPFLQRRDIYYSGGPNITAFLFVNNYENYSTNEEQEEICHKLNQKLGKKIVSNCVISEADKLIYRIEFDNKSGFREFRTDL